MSTLTARQIEPLPREWSLADRERLTDLGLIADPGEAELRFTVHDCVKLWNHGFLDGVRSHLIRGQVMIMGRAGEPHSCNILLLLSVLQHLFGANHTVRVQMPLMLSLDTDPEPDIAVVVGSPRDYRTWPTTALLVVEVSDTTLDYDLTVKAELYASVNIAEYWVLDVNSRRLIVLRDPAPIAAGGTAHRTQLIRYAGDTIASLMRPEATLAVLDLLP